MRFFRISHWLRSSLWFVPVVCVLGGVGSSVATIWFDERFKGLFPRIYTIGAEAALAILATVAASMVSLAALVLTITMVVVQLAMGQFSPRIVRTFLRDRPSQYAIGVFVATFAHAMLAMGMIRASDEQGGSVPGLAIVFAFGLVIVSIMVLVYYVDHIGQSLRVAAIIGSVGDETRELVDKMYPNEGGIVRGGRSGSVIAAPKQGVVFRVDHKALVAQARDAACMLEMIPALGDFVPIGAPIFRIHGDAPGLRDEDVISAVALGPERTMDQDVAYGFRLLVDVAIRSLSDLNDPTTAVQAIDRIHACLRQLAIRPLPTGRHMDGEGRVRLIVPTIGWDGYVRLAFDELCLYGEGSLQVSRRLRAALEDLREMALPERVPPLDHQLKTLRESAQRRPQGAAGVADSQGIGSGADVTVVWR